MQNVLFIPLLYFFSTLFLQIDFKLKQGFLDGADVFVDKTIQESLTAIGQFEIQLRSTLHDHNLKGVSQNLSLVFADMILLVK